MVRAFVLVLSLIVLGCVSTAKQRFKKIHVGMYKGDVLDKVGSPVNSQFKNDEYIWTYRFYDGEQTTEREIRLKNDKVTYVGEKPKANPFDRIKIGTDKADVLDLLGFPNRVEKSGASEIWTYQDGALRQRIVITQDRVSGFGSPKAVPADSEGFEVVEPET